MKKLLILFLLAALFGNRTPAQTQVNGDTSYVPGAWLGTQIPNEGTTGTTVYSLAKLTGTGKAIITTTTDTTGIVGIVGAGAGISGNASIATTGQIMCNFDGATVANDYVINSIAVAGDCSDGGALPPGVQSLGRVLTTNGGAGLYLVAVASGSAGGTSLTSDNRWLNNNRFKGPIPYRDVTAYMPAGGCDDTSASTILVYGTITAPQSVLSVSSNNNFENGCGVFVMGAGATSTLATPGQGAAPNPVVVDGAGSTTVDYEVVAIDANYGLSAASAAITVTTAPSTRTATNYVGFFWTGVANAVGYLMYTDQNGGGTYVPLGYSFDCTSMTVGSTCGGVDKGVETNSWTNGAFQLWPLTPPSGNTNQALITTIVSGGGTLSLTLAAAATNSVTNGFTLPDNAPFFKAAILDASNDGGQFDKGTVFIPNGTWFASTLPFPSTGTEGINFLLSGQLQIFGLPIMGPLSGGATTTGLVSFEGHGGLYHGNNWSLSCANIYGYPSLGALFLVSNGKLNLKNICITNYQAGIVSAPGSITTQDVSFSNVGSGPDLQMDNNAFFSLFNRTNWNTSTFNPVWLLGLTNNAHSSVIDFRDNSFISHTIKYDEVYPTNGYFGNITFTGNNDVEDNLDHGFINVTANATLLSNVTIDNLANGDSLTAGQYVVYVYPNNEGVPALNLTIHGQSVGYNGLLPPQVTVGNTAVCRAWTYENSNAGGAGVDSIGYYGNMFGTYTGCDTGITTTGYDVQTSEVLVSGGNDPTYGAGEQIIGHVFRRPQTTAVTGSGSLAAATYYIQVTMVDVAGRESAPSPEISIVAGASSSIAVTSVTQIFYPSSCKIYFGTTSGGETHYFSSTTVTNGTCTYTLTTTAGQSAGSPRAIGNAMRSWLSAENNANSCLFCGTSNGLGTGFLGIGLTSTQYTADVALMAGAAVYVGVPLNGTTLSASGTITTGANGGTAGEILLNGSTSGTANCTAPAVAGTSTNAITCTNNLSAPALVSTVTTGTAPLTIASTTPVANLTLSTYSQLPSGVCAASQSCTSPTFVTPVLGAATGTSVLLNGGATNTFGSGATYGEAACETTFGTTTVSGGATTTTGLTCLPANSWILGVKYIITTTITTAASFTIGDSGSATRYCGTQSTLTSGTAGICTAAGFYFNSGALGVKITPNTTPGAGAIRLVVTYLTLTAPIS